MNYDQRWHVIGELGSGGQGIVYRTIDRKKYDFKDAIPMQLINSMRSLFNYGNLGPRGIQQQFELFKECIIKSLDAHNPQNQFALKVLHQPIDDVASKRIKREIVAMQEIDHPSLMKVEDADNDAKWFVMRYFINGTLSNNLNRYKGQLLKSLKAIRPLIHGVSILHSRGIIHRDIKPQNVFIEHNNDLVLGDFGLVFFQDKDHSRISNTFENVGSWRWMPPWATNKRIDEVNPSFDVFSLGKLLWSMISGLPNMNLWYYDHPEYDVTGIFPNDDKMRLANILFSKCIVQYENNAFTDASLLLKEVDEIITTIENNTGVIDSKSELKCSVCAYGHYKLKIDRDPELMSNFGIKAVANHLLKIYICDYCGNAQLFSMRTDYLPPLWKE